MTFRTGLAVVLMIILVSITGCTSMDQTVQSTQSTQSTIETSESAETYLPAEAVSTVEDYQDILGAIDALESTITFMGDKIVAGKGVEVEGTEAYIIESGTYTVSGTANGKIVVHLTEKGSVNLVLNGLDLTSAEGVPISVKEAEGVVITIAGGTENIIVDKSVYSESDEETAAIYSKDDLYIRGAGELSIYSEQKSGIQSKDQLVVLGGQIMVGAKKDAIKAKDYVVVEDGVLSLSSGEDGITATSEEGFIIISGGTININSAQDGIQAETYAIINDVLLNIATTGSDSSKGIKAANYVEINGGEINIDSADDSIHSDNTVVINGGSITVLSDDDGVHADSKLTINGGTLDIKECYEGLESRNIEIYDGIIHIKSSDDGINIAAGSSGNSRGGMATLSDALLKIAGGYIYMDANGDGLDSNGNFYMSAGTVIVNGPLRNDNGGIDVNGECIVDGGYLAVAGSSGMAEAPDSTSSQNSVKIGFSSQLPAGTLVYIESKDGEGIVAFAPSKAFQSFVFSSDKLASGETYVVYTGGTVVGTSENGLYESIQSKGELFEEFTITTPITTIGVTGGMGGPGQMGGPMGDQMGGQMRPRGGGEMRPGFDNEMNTQMSDACEGKNEGDSCTIQSPMGEEQGTCTLINDNIICMGSMRRR
jgi:hypothetical protein